MKNTFADSWKLRLTFSILIFVLSFFISQIVFLNAPITTDENSYVFQAYNFAEGRIARPLPPFRDFFRHEMMIMDEDAGWLSRYPPGHSAWLTPGALLGWPRFMVFLAAGLSTWVMLGIATSLGVPMVIMGVMLLLSPYFLFMHGTLYSHSSGFLAAALMLFGYLRWKQKSWLAAAAGAGLAWAWLFLNRSFTAMLIAAPFGLDALDTLFRNRTWKTLGGVALFALSAALGGSLYFWYNYAAVGDPFLSTYLFYEPSEGLGFGPRHTQGIVYHHTLMKGIVNTAGNLHLLNGWLFGWPCSLIVATVLCWIGWRKRWSPLLISATLLVWLGYLFFWFEGIPDTGPIYYFESLPFILAATSLGLTRVKAWAAKYRLSRHAAWLLLILCVGLTGRFMLREGSVNRARRYEYEKVLSVLRRAPDNAIVFMDLQCSFHHCRKGTLFNPRGLRSQPLLMQEKGDLSKAFARYFTNHVPYRLQTEGGYKLQPIDPKQPIRFSMRHATTHYNTGRNMFFEETADLVRLAEEGRDHKNWFVFGRHVFLSPGQYQVLFDVSLDGCDTNAPVWLDAASQRGREVFASSNIVGTIQRSEIALDIHVPSFTEVEPRIKYGGSGKLVLYGIHIQEVL